MFLNGSLVHHANTPMLIRFLAVVRKGKQQFSYLCFKDIDCGYSFAMLIRVYIVNNRAQGSE